MKFKNKLPKLLSGRLIFKQLLKLPKRIKDRVKYGFCDIDVWDADSYLNCVLPNLLEALAGKGGSGAGNSFPGIGKYSSAEEWENALLRAASLLRDSADYENWENPYEEEYIKGILNTKMNEDGSITFSNDEDEINKKYFAKLEENYNNAVKMRNEALNFIRDNYNQLWD